ncbi:MAG: TIGR04076 family protein [Candidatus Thorarchaeota archaeon]
MKNYKIKLEITDIQGDGTCPRGHKVGDVFSFPDDIGKLCQSAYNSIYPTIRVMQSGGSFPWFKPDPNTHERCCPDPKRPVVIKISREEIPET